VQGNIDGPNLGDSAGAMESYRKALGIRESLAGENPGQSPEELAYDYERVGIALEGTGNYAAALDEFQKTLPFRGRLAAARPGPESEERLAGAYFQIAYCESNLGRDQSALENYQKIGNPPGSDNRRHPGAQCLCADEAGGVLWLHVRNLVAEKRLRSHYRARKQG